LHPADFSGILLEWHEPWRRQLMDAVTFAQINRILEL